MPAFAFTCLSARVAESVRKSGVLQCFFQTDMVSGWTGAAQEQQQQLQGAGQGPQQPADFAGILNVHRQQAALPSHVPQGC